MNSVSEWQFDGLVGPTHNYAGLAHGNMASARNAGLVSNPRAAALQGLQKMQFIRNLVLKQAVLPPHPRPAIALLQRLGFGQGSSRDAVAHTIDLAHRTASHILAAAFSSSFMWAANAATVSPSADTRDGKLHLTPANLNSHLHRSIEPDFTHVLLRRIFANEQKFSVHNPLPSTRALSDEGAANHMRIINNNGDDAFNIFVYGAGGDNTALPKQFVARQQMDASMAIARSHGLNPKRTFFVQQDPKAIDRGVFHNDVIAMNTNGLMIAHKKAFIGNDEWRLNINNMMGGAFQFIAISETDLSVEEAVASYLFNSQLLCVQNQYYVLVAPSECTESPNANAMIQSWLERGIISAVHFIDVRESMRNGGGPACLRLRVSMTEEESSAMHQGIVLTDARHALLVAWVKRHYRDRLALDDFRDPALLEELQTAYAALEPIIEMHGLYTAQS